ncbi:MAG: FAD-dependent oxidoreductase [Deltaproteobacteria bacterium]|nr:MAG: FAD-dependent oxidoreductase [Deltaproteobacteria bacterium]
MNKQIGWTEEAEVVVVGYGGAGAVAAVAAHDAGAKVLILEKQPSDSPTQTRHTPSTRMSGGGWFWPTDVDRARLYLEGMVKIANEILDAERKELLSIFAEHLASNTDWMKEIGVPIGGEESVSPMIRQEHGVHVVEGRLFMADFPELPGSECSSLIWSKASGNYRSGAALFKHLSEAVKKRDIQIMWETPAVHLVTHDGEVRGVVAIHGGKELRIKASRAVVFTCGGFEFNHWMKENYLGVVPVHFHGNPGNTGDGINMAMEVGAALWHMNKASWRVTMKFPDFPMVFATQRHETASIFVDKRGKRFTNERFKMHAFGYELTNYDCYAQCYPKVPCYWIFDEERRALAPLASYSGACNPPGGVMGDIYYIWSADNKAEIDRGWIMKANTIEELASKILADPDNSGLMSPSVLRATVKHYNEYCRKGEDLDFHKPQGWLQSLEDPPFYAVKLWPGGPNTQGGPKRNERGQILRVDNTPIPRLYSAGELGSVWGMLYQGGGNIAECIAFGRIAGANAAAEKVWK